LLPKADTVLNVQCTTTEGEEKAPLSPDDTILLDDSDYMADQGDLEEEDDVSSILEPRALRDDPTIRPLGTRLQTSRSKSIVTMNAEFFSKRVD
jgi:hypothetical protein